MSRARTVVLAALASYLIGSLPVAVAISRRYGIDPRSSGDRNPGAWNVRNLAGRRAGIWVLILDQMKGAAAVSIGRRLSGNLGGVFGLLAAMGGHAWPWWSGFRGGGRSVAVLVGGELVISPRTALFSVPVAWIGYRWRGARGGASIGLLAYPVIFAVVERDLQQLAGLGLAYLVILARLGIKGSPIGKRLGVSPGLTRRARQPSGTERPPQ